LQPFRFFKKGQATACVSEDGGGGCDGTGWQAILTPSKKEETQSTTFRTDAQCQREPVIGG